MPLPAALAARLAKRGLITGSEKHESGKKEAKKRVHEEVIAEDYDNTKEEINQIDISQKFMGYSGCPNKYNIYHECTRKCKELWGMGHAQPSDKYLKQQMRLIQKYPLPETWKTVYDPGSGQHYYWDWSSDLVSWLPPGHPKCQISQPASQLREELHLKAGDQDDNMSSDDSTSDQEQMEVEESEPVKKDRKIENRARYKGPDNKRPYRSDRIDGKDMKDRTLDPMDPASYSDIPRGKWSDGLAKHNEAKTGADTTASGPLYQMRPYPSPGAVLRSNRANKTESESSNKPKVAFRMYIFIRNRRRVRYVDKLEINFKIGFRKNTLPPISINKRYDVMMYLDFDRVGKHVQLFDHIVGRLYRLRLIYTKCLVIVFTSQNCLNKIEKSYYFSQ